MIRTILKCIVYVVEKFIAELALIAAILSTTVTGNVPERIVGGIMSVINLIIKIVDVYVKNTGVRTVINNFGASALKSIGNIGDNLQKDPRLVLIVFVSVYVLVKLIALCFYFIRRALRKKSEVITTPTKPQPPIHQKTENRPKEQSVPGPSDETVIINTNQR